MPRVQGGAFGFSRAGEGLSSFAGVPDAQLSSTPAALGAKIIEPAVSTSGAEEPVVSGLCGATTSALPDASLADAGVRLDARRSPAPVAVLVVAVLMLGSILSPYFLVQFNEGAWRFPSVMSTKIEVPTREEGVKLAGRVLSGALGLGAAPAFESPTFLAGEVDAASDYSPPSESSFVATGLEAARALIAVRPWLGDESLSAQVAPLLGDVQARVDREANPGDVALASWSELVNLGLIVEGGVAFSMVAALGEDMGVMDPPQQASIPSSIVDRGGGSRVRSVPSAEEADFWARMLDEDEEVDRKVRDWLANSMSDEDTDEFINELSNRVRAEDAPQDNDIPLHMRRKESAGDTGDLNFVPFSRRFTASATAPLPPPIPQPAPAHDFAPTRITDIISNDAKQQIDTWLRKMRWNLAAARSLGPDAPDCRKEAREEMFGKCVRALETLVIGQDQFHQPAKSIIWDLRPMKEGGPAVPLDYGAAISSDWNNDYIEERLLGSDKWPDQQVVDMVLHGVRYQANVDMQIVLCPHLSSLALNVEEVEKNFVDHLNREEYSITDFIPFLPCRVTPQGVVQQKGKWRRTSDLGAPRKEARDEKGVPASSINKAIDLRKSLKRAARISAQSLAAGGSAAAAHAGRSLGGALGAAMGSHLGAHAGATTARLGAAALGAAGARLGQRVGGIAGARAAERLGTMMEKVVPSPSSSEPKQDQDEVTFSIVMDEPISDFDHDLADEFFFLEQQQSLTSEPSLGNAEALPKWTAPETKPRPEDVAFDCAILQHAAELWQEPLLGGTDDVHPVWGASFGTLEKHDSLAIGGEYRRTDAAHRGATAWFRHEFKPKRSTALEPRAHAHVIERLRRGGDSTIRSRASRPVSVGRRQAVDSRQAGAVQSHGHPAAQVVLESYVHGRQRLHCSRHRARRTALAVLEAPLG
jgi:hypothetical protein